MANVIGAITVNQADILEVDAVPSAGGGTIAALSSLALYDDGATGRLYIKSGILDTNWTEVNLSGSSLKTKTGTITAASFTGSPRKYTVTFGTAFPNASYAISLSSTDNRNLTWELKTAGSFVINANAAAALTGNVDWVAIEIGEST